MSGRLPTWIEHALGLTAPRAGQAVRWHLDWAWDIPTWMTLLLVAGVATYVVGIYRQESPTGGRRAKTACVVLRWALLAWILIMCAAPRITLERTGLPSVAVLIDDSASMGTADRYDSSHRARLDRRLRATGLAQPTRLNLAKMLLTGAGAGDGLLRRVSRHYQLKVYSMASLPRRHMGDLDRLIGQVRGLTPHGSSSRLGLALHTVLAENAGAPPAAMILLTDGITTQGPTLSEAALDARRQSVPLLVVGLGSAKAQQDVQLTDVLVDEVVFAGDVVNFQCTVRATGFAGREAEIVLREVGKPAVLARAAVRLGPDGASRTVQLPYRPSRVGELALVVEVKPLADEARADNNRAERLVRVRKQQIRVLLLEGYPNYEFRYLKQLLDRDPTVELKTLLQDADPEYAQIDRSALPLLPADRDAWFAYDVIIMGDMDPTLLGDLAMKNIRDFVREKGGGIVFLSGPRFMPLAYRATPLAALFPVRLAAARVLPPVTGRADAISIRPTDLGLASPGMQLGDTAAETAAIWRSLPPIYWCLETPDVKPAARILADNRAEPRDGHRRLPIICLQFVGAGRVLMHATDATWRWRLGAGDSYFGRYWLQSLRYLARAKLLGQETGAELASDRRNYRYGEPVRLRVRFADPRHAPAANDGVILMVAARAGRRRQVTLHRTATRRGVFDGMVTRLDPGAYHAWMVAPASERDVPATDFLVAAPADEWQRVRMDVADLARAAQVSGGRFFTIDSVASLPAFLPAGKQVAVETLPPLVLWNQWWVLLAALGMLLMEWLLRKRNGLL